MNTNMYMAASKHACTAPSSATFFELSTVLRLRKHTERHTEAHTQRHTHRGTHTHTHTHKHTHIDMHRHEEIGM